MRLGHLSGGGRAEGAGGEPGDLTGPAVLRALLDALDGAGAQGSAGK
ncbi:hypothetical protein [Modestobacter sp. VKM Ac-2984]|nr:hypothetical protein [Modestobacter sp. VKM Ac-2984]MCZ2817888.1 hypothetical protein [Modestobacter sp. VKM Ac-2984]